MRARRGFLIRVVQRKFPAVGSGAVAVAETDLRGARAGTLGTLCATSRKLYNYGCDNFAGFPNTRDVGLVILDQPITVSKCGQLPAAGVLDRIGTSRGTQKTVFTVSGYGLSLRAQEHSAIPNQSFR